MFLSPSHVEDHNVRCSRIWGCDGGVKGSKGSQPSADLSPPLVLIDNGQRNARDGPPVNDRDMVRHEALAGWRRTRRKSRGQGGGCGCLSGSLVGGPLVVVIWFPPRWPIAQPSHIVIVSSYLVP
jgi:hypothetical protein